MQDLQTLGIAPAATFDMSTGLLIGRLVIGPLMAAHGAQKLFGWFGGHGLGATAGFFDAIGFRPGLWFAAAASGAEVLSGVLIAFGLFGPAGPAMMLSVMVVAAISMHWKQGLFASANGIEVPLLYASAGVALALTGPGQFSLDTLLGWSGWWNTTLISTALVLAIAGGVGSLLLRRQTVPVAA